MLTRGDRGQGSGPREGGGGRPPEYTDTARLFTSAGPRRRNTSAPASTEGDGPARIDDLNECERDGVYAASERRKEVHERSQLREQLPIPGAAAWTSRRGGPRAVRRREPMASWAVFTPLKSSRWLCAGGFSCGAAPRAFGSCSGRDYHACWPGAGDTEDGLPHTERKGMSRRRPPGRICGDQNIYVLQLASEDGDARVWGCFPMTACDIENLVT